MDACAVWQKARTLFDGGQTLPLEARRASLRALRAAVTRHEQRLLEGLQADFGKCAFDGYATEILMVLEEIDEAVRRLSRWAKPRRVGVGLANLPASGRIHPQPLGAVLVLSPWNYPILLALAPVVGALAAGNTVVLKPTTQTPHVLQELSALLQEAFPQGEVQVAVGGHDVSDALLTQPFDLIFFTGSAAVGRHVMELASRHLTPVVLELGGKSPCLVAASADLQRAARRIAWGKFVNGGQTCVAPDYLLVEEAVAQPLLEELLAAVRQFYEVDGRLSPDFAAIISDRHYARLMGYCADGQVRCGGRGDAATRRMEPTILTGVSPEAAVMQEEIFGPVLPILTVPSMQAAVDFVRARPNPLALYLFTRDRKQAEWVLAHTASGGGCINDTVMHVSCVKLPFGGVGMSGMGKYHGKASFDTFSNLRGILHKSARWEVPLKYPPHRPGKVDVLKRLMGQK